MPYSLELTWISQCKRWRKRYRNRTYYLKSRANGNKDREGYLAALREGERLKAYIDGLSPNPHTATGVLIPENQVYNPVSIYLPPAPTPVQSIGVATGPTPSDREQGSMFYPARSPDDPPWILSVGIGASQHPELVAVPRPSNLRCLGICGQSNL